jgi:hypothetical protein
MGATPHIGYVGLSGVDFAKQSSLNWLRQAELASSPFL